MNCCTNHHRYNMYLGNQQNYDTKHIDDEVKVNVLSVIIATSCTEYQGRTVDTCVQSFQSWLIQCANK